MSQPAGKDHRPRVPRIGGDVLWPVVSGLLLVLAFPPWRLWPLIFLAWIPLWVHLDRRLASGPAPSWRGTFLQGWGMGCVGFIGMLHWILGLSNEELAIPGLMIPALGLLGLYLGVFFGLAALAPRWLARWVGVPFLVLAPAVGLLCEWLRAQGPLGFPWGAAGYALARVPPMIQGAALVGFWGLVFFVLIINALLAGAVRGRRAGLPAALVLITLVGVGGAWVLAAHPVGTKAAGSTAMTVLIAQPDIRREMKWKPEHREEVIRRVLAHGAAAAEQGRREGGFDLFIWPETVLPVLLLQEPQVLARVQGFVEALDRPLLLGTQEGFWHGPARTRDWLIYNSALVFYPDGGRSPTYRKMKLVPFSEQMPLQKLAPWLKEIDFGQSDFSAGEDPILFPVAGEQIGCLICFESVFPEVARQLVREGAGVLVNITNDFWFGRTAGPAQHAEMAILRAVENRVPVVRCANTGISMIIDPWGRVRQETAVFTPDALRGEICAGAGSPAVRVGDGMLGLVAAGILFLILARWFPRRGGGRAS